MLASLLYYWKSFIVYNLVIALFSWYNNIVNIIFASERKVIMDAKLRNEFLKDLLDLVAIESVTGNEAGIKACFRCIENIANRFGFCCKRCADGKVLEVFPKYSCLVPKLGVVTHVDTVPLNEDKWNFNPLGEIVDDRVYGRGIIDDKMGVISSLYVFYELDEMIEHSWKLIIGSSEEVSWDDMRDYIDEGNTIPQFVFTIDGDGIQNGCRGTLNVDLIFDRDKFISNPALEKFETVGGVVNMVPDKVLVGVSGIEETFYGRAAHSSIPQYGVNAIQHAYESFYYLFESEFPGFAKFMNTCIGMNMKKGKNAMYIEDGGRIISNESVPDTIVTPTLCKLTDNTLTVTANVRLSPSIMTKETIRYGIERSAMEYGCTIDTRSLIMPSYVRATHKEIGLMEDAYEKVMGKRAKANIALGTGYNAIFLNAAIFGPRFDVDDDELDLCHCPDESRNISDIEKFYDILKEYIRRSLAA